MFPCALNERMDSLIDDLIMNGGVEAASLASIILAAKDSVRCNYHVTLSRLVWTAVNEIRAESTGSSEGDDRDSEPNHSEFGGLPPLD